MTAAFRMVALTWAPLCRPAAHQWPRGTLMTSRLPHTAIARVRSSLFAPTVRPGRQWLDGIRSVKGTPDGLTCCGGCHGTQTGSRSTGRPSATPGWYSRRTAAPPARPRPPAPAPAPRSAASHRCPRTEAALFAIDDPMVSTIDSGHHCPPSAQTSGIEVTGTRSVKPDAYCPADAAGRGPHHPPRHFHTLCGHERSRLTIGQRHMRGLCVGFGMVDPRLTLPKTGSPRRGLPAKRCMPAPRISGIRRH